MRFWSRSTLFIGIVAVSLYFIFDPATPKLYKLLIVVGLLGLLLYCLLGGAVATRVMAGEMMEVFTIGGLAAGSDIDLI